MTNNHMSDLCVRLSALENDLQSLIAESREETEVQHHSFEQPSAQTIHRQKKGILAMMLNKRPQNLITGPIIYSMIFPLFIFDIFISFYHASCFPIYQIEKVCRKDYIVFDRQKLSYLNIIEKFHCIYCAYGAGLIAYASEIIGRTEEYFCPIKHAHKIAGRHSHYAQFIEYGDTADLEGRLEEFRIKLSHIKDKHSHN